MFPCGSGLRRGAAGHRGAPRRAVPGGLASGRPTRGDSALVCVRCPWRAAAERGLCHRYGGFRRTARLVPEGVPCGRREVLPVRGGTQNGKRRGAATMRAGANRVAGRRRQGRPRGAACRPRERGGADPAGRARTSPRRSCRSARLDERRRCLPRSVQGDAGGGRVAPPMDAAWPRVLERGHARGESAAAQPQSASGRRALHSVRQITAGELRGVRPVDRGRGAAAGEPRGVGGVRALRADGQEAARDCRTRSRAVHGVLRGTCPEAPVAHRPEPVRTGAGGRV